MNQFHPIRVMTYIDGFNLYYGLRAAKFHRFYWLDMVKLVEQLLKPDQNLEFTRYFTARIAGPKPEDSPEKGKRLMEKLQRQADYLDALATRPNMEIIEGHYLPKPKRCLQCNATWTQHEEKMTDVNIATKLLVDSFNDAFDVALIVSGDSDLTPPVLAVREFHPEKKVIIAFPPKRHSVQLKRAAHAAFTIGRAKLRDSQLPDEVQVSETIRLKRPERWR